MITVETLARLVLSTLVPAAAFGVVLVAGVLAYTRQCAARRAREVRRWRQANGVTGEWSRR
jgi:hypothetical protein